MWTSTAGRKKNKMNKREFFKLHVAKSLFDLALITSEIILTIDQ